LKVAVGWYPGELSRAPGDILLVGVCAHLPLPLPVFVLSNLRLANTHLKHNSVEMEKAPLAGGFLVCGIDSIASLNKPRSDSFGA
jgi:hypothetical protein